MAEKSIHNVFFAKNYFFAKKNKKKQKKITSEFFLPKKMKRVDCENKYQKKRQQTIMCQEFAGGDEFSRAEQKRLLLQSKQLFPSTSC